MNVKEMSIEELYAWLITTNCEKSRKIIREEIRIRESEH